VQIRGVLNKLLRTDKIVDQPGNHPPMKDPSRTIPTLTHFLFGFYCLPRLIEKRRNDSE
jgi:hypothetical protein